MAVDLSTLTSPHGETVGWFVRVGCETFVAYKAPKHEPGQVIDLLRDGELLGIAGDEAGAVALVELAAQAVAA